MTDIKCMAINCGFNQEKTCKKKCVKVEGLFSRSKLGTFCQSFRNPIEKSDFKEELASDFMDKNIGSKLLCSANYCLYNKDNCCMAQAISVGQKNAKYRSETQCDSFELK